MRLNSKGQVTIPAVIREKHGRTRAMRPTSSRTATHCVSCASKRARRERLVGRMRGRATPDMSTDQLLGLLRAE
jgi:hypothetical protein